MALKNTWLDGEDVDGTAMNDIANAVNDLTAAGDGYTPGGTDVAVADGGTGASTALGARSNLSVMSSAEVTAAITAAVTALLNGAPGALDTLKELADALNDDASFAATVTAALAGKQPSDATLTALAGVTTAANKLIYATGVDTFSTTDFTAAGRALLDDADAAAQRATLGLDHTLAIVTYSGSLTTARPTADAVYWIDFPSTPTNALSQDIIAGSARTVRRVVPVTQSATPTILTDTTDVASITGLAQPITGFTMTGTPVAGDQLTVEITDNGTSQAIVWGSSFEAGTLPLPQATAATVKLVSRFDWNPLTSKWRGSAIPVPPRLNGSGSTATPAINTDYCDFYIVTGLLVDITGFVVTGTPFAGQRLVVGITGTASRAITWGSAFEASSLPLPNTTSGTNTLFTEFIYNPSTGKWRLANDIINLPLSQLAPSTTLPLSVGTLELGNSSDTTLARISAGAVAVEGVRVALNSTTLVHTASTIELGAATDTTLSRAAAGVLAVEGRIVAFRDATINPQTGTAYTLALVDVDNVVTASNASAQTYSFPQNSDVAIPIGSSGQIIVLGAGQVTFAAGTGATVNARGGALKSAGQYAAIGWLKVSTNGFVLLGDLST